MGSAKGSQTIGYNYYMSLHIGIARGPIDEIVQMNAGDIRAWPIPDGDPEEISGLMVVATGPGGTGVEQYEDGTYATVSGVNVNTISASGDYTIDAPELFGGEKKEGGIAGALRVMMGAASQVVPSYIKTLMGGLVPDFRGVATVYFDGLLCSINPYPKKWEWRVRRTENGWDGEIWEPSLVTIWMRGNTIKAMNPAHMVYECLTNRDWGRGMPRTAIKDDVWAATAQTLFDEGLGLCMRYTRQSELSAFIQTIVDHIGGTIYPDRSTGQLALSLLRGGYDPETIPLFTYNTGLLKLEDVETASQEDVVNEIIVKWTDPISKTERSSRVQNIASRQTMGATNSTTTSYAGVPEVDLSLRLCQRDLKASANSLKRFRVQLDRRAQRLVPGSLFRVSVPERGIYNAILRAGNVSEAGGTDGRIKVDAVLDVFGLPSASFVSAQQSNWVPPNREAMVADRRVVREATYMELVLTIDPANLAILSTSSAALATIAGKPSSLSQGYDVEVLPDGATTPVIGHGTFAPYIVTTTLIPQEPGPTVVSFDTSVDIGLISLGMALQIGNEICRLDAMAIADGAGTITIARGCVDTVPLEHAIGATVFFLSTEVGGDGKEYASGESLDVKLLPFTSSSKLSSSLAPVDTLALVGRQGRPYAPGNVLVNGASFAGVPLADDEVVLTWTHRDRLIQQDQLVSHEEASVGPEFGTTYNVRVFDGDVLSPVRSVVEIEGTTWTYTSAMAIADGVGTDLWFELESERDGLVSFNKYRFGIAFALTGYGLSGYGDSYGL